MKLDNLDVIVKNVPAAAAFFRDVVGLTLRVNEERYAELDAGPVTLMLSPDAMVPMKQAAGVILHFQVEDVAQALEKARSKGAKVLLEVTRTDWGTESAMIAGPEDVVIDFYRWVGPHYASSQG
jgi:predicted enzyme related to lactoylglutathione lyase